MKKEHTLGAPASGRFIEIVMNNKALFILGVLVIIASLISPNFLTVRNISNISKQVAASTIMAMGYTLVLGSANMDLSVGFLLGMLGIIAAKLDTAGVSFAVVVLVVMVIGAVSSMCNAFFISTFNLPPFVVTLAMGQVFKGICYVISNTSAISGLSPSFLSMGQGSIGPVPVPVLISIAVTLIMCVVVYRTAFGRNLLAVGANAEAARVSGLDVKRIRYITYALMGICVAIAALVLTGRSASAQPQAGQGMENDALSAVVIGGTPLGGGYCKPAGTFFGCLVIGLINNILNLLSVDSNWQFAAKGATIIFAIILDSQSEKILERRRLKAIK